MQDRYQLSKSLISVLGLVGVITVAVLAPNALVIFADNYKGLNKYSGRKIKRSIMGLERSKIISIKEKDGKTAIELTKKGQVKLLEYQVEEMKIVPQKRWDKKWRIVIFDIPESFKINRKAFQERLRDIGFIMLQKSVWVCPYPCENEVDFLKELYNIGKYVRLITAQEIDIAADLKIKFHLT